MIKAFIIAAMTVDGCIAKEVNHAAFWTSKEDKGRFVELTRRAGVIVMGSTTFSTLPHPLKERVNIVYSRRMIDSSEEKKKFEGVEITQKNPLELLQELESRGFKEVAICGGSQIYTMFMKSGVVDRLYLTIEPLVFGNGLRLFKENLSYNIKLKDVIKTENGALLLEYEVSYLEGMKPN